MSSASCSPQLVLGGALDLKLMVMAQIPFKGANLLFFFAALN